MNGNKNSLTITVVCEAESLSYGESIGNVSPLKKITRADGKTYSMLTRQGLRYNIVTQMNIPGFNPNDTSVTKTDRGDVLQFAVEDAVKKSAELDFFGYMSTKDSVNSSRSAICRLSNVISLEEFNSDLDFSVNKFMYDRFSDQNPDVELAGGNINQSEMHRSLYVYTLCLDLDLVGVDKNDGLVISTKERKDRVKGLLEATKLLNRGIKGRQENMNPVFVIGGVYARKNPYFENRIKVKHGKLDVNMINSVLKMDEDVRENTFAGIIEGVFSNEKEISDALIVKDIGSFYNELIEKVNEYYDEADNN